MPERWGFVDLILRAEYVAAFVAGVFAWFLLDGAWWLLLLVILLPDVSIAGYAVSPAIGAVTYNLVHNFVGAAVLLVAGLAAESDPVALAGAVLLAHTGMDRALGYGLKLNAFSETHLGRIGRRA